RRLVPCGPPAPGAEPGRHRHRERWGPPDALQPVPGLVGNSARLLHGVACLRPPSLGLDNVTCPPHKSLALGDEIEPGLPADTVPPDATHPDHRLGRRDHTDSG